MIKQIIAELIEGKDLEQVEMRQAMEEIMQGTVNSSQIASFLVALRIKGETISEITAAAKVMRKFVRPIHTEAPIVLDTCGTGGDCLETFNISTVSSLVAAGCGVVIAKHGNRAVSSHCGSADLLEELGVNININEKKVEDCLNKTGIGFLFAPSLHPAMKYVASVRRELGLRTIFNILGPLTNPACASHQLLGVYDLKLLKVIGAVLKNLGLKHAMVVRGLDGLDEITICRETAVCELKDGKLRSYNIEPGDFGIKRAKLEDIRGGNIKVNAEIAREILQGKSGPKRDIVVLNAGCALYVADKAKNIKEGIKLACEAIDSGAAWDKLEELIRFTNN